MSNRFADTLFDLDGRTALITGGSRGIGRAIAERIAQHGANLVVSGRKPEAAQEAAATINARGGGRAVAVSANITRRDELHTLVEDAEATFGTIDILVA